MIISKEVREELKTRILLAMRSGLSFCDAVNSVGVGLTTAEGWLKRDRFFKRGVKNLRERVAKEVIESGLMRLASGLELVELRESWSYEDDRGTVSCSKVTKEQLPNVNAIKLLANKYAPNEYSENINEVSIKITQRDRSLSTEERLKLLGSKSLSKEDIEATYKLIEDRVKEIDLG